MNITIHNMDIKATDNCSEDYLSIESPDNPSLKNNRRRLNTTTGLWSVPETLPHKFCGFFNSLISFIWFGELSFKFVVQTTDNQYSYSGFKIHYEVQALRRIQRDLRHINDPEFIIPKLHCLLRGDSCN